MSIRSTLPPMQSGLASQADRKTLPATTKLQAPSQASQQSEVARKAAVAANQKTVSTAGPANLTLPSLSSIDPEDRGRYLEAAKSIAANQSTAAQAKFSDADSQTIHTISDYISALQGAIDNGYSRFA